MNYEHKEKYGKFSSIVQDGLIIIIFIFICSFRYITHTEQKMILEQSSARIDGLFARI